MASVRIKHRDIAFDEIDEALLSLAIVETFPMVIFQNGGRPAERPEIESKGSIPDCSSSIVDIWVSEPGWQPQYQRDLTYPNWFNLLNPPAHAAFYFRSAWHNNFPDPESPKWAFKGPTLDNGWISSNIKNDDPADKAFVSALWKIITKLSAARYCLGYSDWKTPLKQTARYSRLLGNHALAWCKQDERRMLMGCAHPCPDWQPPDTKWHRDLSARFEVWRQRWPGGIVPKLPTDRRDEYGALSKELSNPEA